MCGISGVLSNDTNTDTLESNVHLMLDAIAHRGPDDSGVLVDGSVILGHRRLAIIDLSPLGHQPMSTFDGRYTIVFNGEIYNYKELKLELTDSGFNFWKGHSDTEVMLAAFLVWGVEKSLQKFNGMFAFALWDKVEKRMTLARDRFGEKPLYYYYKDGNFYFSSEITSFECIPELELKINRKALTHHLEKSYIPAPISIYTNISKLPPGHFLNITRGEDPKILPYWSFAHQVSKAKKNIITDELEAFTLLDEALIKSVKSRMISDVPLGAFLSGGVDSSLVVALMQSISNQPVNTFSIGFNVDGYNEAIFAKKVAKHLGTNHTEHYLEAHDALAVVPKLGGMFDEPFSDASQIPTYLVSSMARKHVKVCLSGDGGDELFFGYKRYMAVIAMWTKMKMIPCKRLIARLLNNAPMSLLEVIFFFLKPVAEKYGRAGAIGPKMKRFSEWLKAKDVTELYELTMIHWKNAPDVVLRGGHADIWRPEAEMLDTIEEQMMYLDTISYLPGDILTKVDRATMTVSLEGRMPLLDPAIAEIAWRLPMHMKQRGDCGKYLLKKVLYKYLPQELMERPKMGFGVPIHEWLNSSLREWSNDLLSYERLHEQNLYNPKEISEKLRQHRTNEANNSVYLWDVLMVQAWLDANPERSLKIN